MHNIGAELFGDGAVRRRALIGRLCSVQSLAPHGLIDKWRNRKLAHMPKSGIIPIGIT